MTMFARRSRPFATIAVLGMLAGCTATGESGSVDKAWGLGGVQLAPPPAPAEPPPSPPAPTPAAVASGDAPVSKAGTPLVLKPDNAPAPAAQSPDAAPAKTPDAPVAPPPADPLAVAAAAARGFDNLEAATQYQRILNDNPDSLDAGLGLATAFLGDGLRDRAEATVADLQKRFPNEPRVVLLRARLNLAGGNLSEAAVLLISAAAKLPDSRDVQLTRGVLEDLRGDHAAAQAAYRRGLALSPDDPVLQNNLAMSLIGSGNPEDAAALLQKLIPNPQSAAAVPRHNLALAYGVMGKEDEARKLLQADLTSAEIDENIQFYRESRKSTAGK